MNRNVLHWLDRSIPFQPGETVAAVLERAGIHSFGKLTSGQDARYFCGIGACQSCLVQIGPHVREACLTRATPGMRVAPIEVTDE